MLVVGSFQYSRISHGAPAGERLSSGEFDLLPSEAG